ncbi:YhgE/Pip domain-containing protein [Saccharibacillus deserti]|uniref:YhgE/Pip domain-containing protein n=1 Tax=Saccharibacillus deserti TaxID=1634444 RepID=UPI001FE5C73B|nr:ABC transporter permease [Saccharibacillus deserti]
MNQAFKTMMSITTTRIGIVFALFVPLLFVLLWMTGYQDATQRIDRLQVAIVNEAGEAGAAISQQIEASAPFGTEIVADLDQAVSAMDSGDYSMVIRIPADFAASLQQGSAKLVYTINQGTSEVAAAMMEGAASQLTEGMNTAIAGGSASMPVQAEIVKTHDQGNFAVTMLPMILGFIPYIAMMTMNIQFNITAQIMKHRTGKWAVFWSRQLLLLLICAAAPLVIVSVARLFVEPAAPLWSMWLMLGCVFLASACLTQMSFALLGNVAPLFNVALVPLQLMTAGNIIPAAMLAPFYRHLGSFLPAPNGIQGFMRLIYNGDGAGVFAWHLLLIALVTWAITLLRTYLQPANPVPAAAAQQTGAPGKPSAAH